MPEAARSIANAGGCAVDLPLASSFSDHTNSFADIATRKMVARSTICWYPDERRDRIGLAESVPAAEARTT